MTRLPEKSELNEQPSAARGPLAIILGGLRLPVSTGLARLSQLAAAGELNARQLEYYNEVVRALQQISRTIEQFAPPEERREARVGRASEHWNAGEQSDALDDRYQDMHLPLEDRPGLDEQP
jgi:hypothetical protein